jgi:hypothetical protein
MASKRQLSSAQSDIDPAAGPAIVANREAALLARRQRDQANKDQASLDASAKIYFAAIDPGAVISY